MGGEDPMALEAFVSHFVSHYTRKYGKTQQKWTESATSFPLLDRRFPAGLLNLILHYSLFPGQVAGSAGRVIVKPLKEELLPDIITVVPNIAVLCTCQAVYKLAQPMLYANAEFVFENREVFTRFATNIYARGSDAALLMKKLELRFSSWDIHAFADRAVYKPHECAAALITNGVARGQWESVTIHAPEYLEEIYGYHKLWNIVTPLLTGIDPERVHITGDYSLETIESIMCTLRADWAAPPSPEARIERLRRTTEIMTPWLTWQRWHGLEGTGMDELKRAYLLLPL